MNRETCSLCKSEIFKISSDLNENVCQPITLLVVNALPTYAFNLLKNCPVDTIQSVILNLYRTDVIHQAKIALWEAYSTQLSKWSDRRKGVGTRQQERELKEIYAVR